MATPTPGKHTGQVVATPPVSTPFSSSNHPSHPAFSPHGPRSVVPSPQQVKKSPANSNTMYGYPGGGGHPTNSSFGVGYDSPSAAMALGGVSGLELGLEGMGTPLGGVGHLAVGAGHNGIGGSGRGDEEDRARRLGAVMDILKTSQGRISEKGIQHLATRLGFASIVQDIEIRSRTTSRPVIIAGEAISVDLVFESGLVKTVLLQFPTSPPIVNKHVDRAGEILMRDLEIAGNESPLSKKLDGFAANLEKLAAQDLLGQTNKPFNCFEAIAGIYENLEKLHKWEVEKLRESPDMVGKDQDFLERAVMCTRSGRPVMHERNRLGLSLDYWQEKRRIGQQKDKTKTWALLVECGKKPSAFYTSARVSENWISAEIEKDNVPAEDLLLAAADGPVLDWLEPETTLIPGPDPPKEGDAPRGDVIELVDETTGLRRPEVMFVAKFDPPLVVPGSVVAQLYHIVNMTFDTTQPTAYFDDLLFPRSPEERYSNDGRVIRCEVTVPVFDKDGKKTTQIHKNNLLVEGFEYGYELTELPFSHPRQLVEMLPYLRQYAFTSTLLEKSFGSSSKTFSTEVKKMVVPSTRSAFDSFMEGTLPQKEMTLDVNLKPGPQIRIVFPFAKIPGSNSAYITFDIKHNGVVEVVEENVLDKDTMSESKMLTSADLGKMLEITEDFGILVEYVQRRL
ncbi:uncharacterized protein LY89DRAFT_614735 [Mollisia scopiformis]|uniref:Mediator of RNA polymerase II transcription subunit 1 n=1 Tax=Mollisia scopiformis TaxID=149040 RepID=A0A194XDE4_MOLSC|nr:uncharacterized protein LY89DRAFT_614735 [Mollisia scopiformis]KUJ18171.1 hypothetical protein LY89DRAFT_614735 [Mollisia scopiformis]